MVPGFDPLVGCPDDEVWFYRADEPKWGILANFAVAEFEMDGWTYPTSEHAFQSLKYENEADVAAIRAAATPKEAAAIGRDRTRVLRSDWEEVKRDMMHKVLLAKFKGNEDARAVLMATGDRRIVERSPKDKFWGDGGDGTGKNVLGEVLMQVRGELQNTV